MLFRFCKPCIELRDYVETILVFHQQKDASEPDPFKPFPPAPEQCLYFYPREKIFHNNFQSQAHFQPFSIIVGPQVSRIDLKMGCNNLMICAIFRPGSLHRLLGIPMKHLFDHYIDSSLIWPGEIRTLEEQMNETDDYNVMVRCVEIFLIKHFASIKKEVHPIDEVFKYMVSLRQNRSIEWLAGEACLSTRQFDRKFYDYIGMSPKVFERIVRFSSAFRMKDSQPEKDWLSIALHSGYYDLKHMLRDFKEFAGTTPKILREEDALTNLKVYTYSTLK